MKLNSIILLFLFFASLPLFAQKTFWTVISTQNQIPDRSECGMAAVDGKLYVIGGDGQQSAPVAVFDPATGIWTKLPVAPLVMHHFQAVSIGKKIFCLDAFSSGGFPNQEPMSNVYDYDVEKNTWEVGSEIPADRRRAAAGAATYNGKLYLVCGIQHGHSSGTNAMFDEYDPMTKTWRMLQDAPHKRDHCSATVMNGKLYVVGGRNTSFRDPENKITFFSQTVLAVDCYDFSSGTWSTLPYPLPLGTGGGALVHVSGKLIYMGGERATTNERNAPRKDVFVLDPEDGKGWQAAPALNFARNGMAAAVVNNTIYVVGGSGGPGAPPPNHPSDRPSQQPPPPMPPSNSPMKIEKLEVER